MLMGVAVVAMGIFALPGTVSLFSGQHSWYGLGASIEVYRATYRAIFRLFVILDSFGRCT